MAAKKPPARESVAIGLDLRPIPVDMGDGRLFHLDGNPSGKAEWFELSNAAVHLASLAGNGKATDPEEALKRLGEFRDAFLPFLPDDEHDEWQNAKYGGMVMQTLYSKYVETLTGLPTTP